MAHFSIDQHGYSGLYLGFFDLYYIKLDFEMQEILVYISLFFALWFLIRKYFLKSKKKNGGCDKDCGC